MDSKERVAECRAREEALGIDFLVARWERLWACFKRETQKGNPTSSFLAGVSKNKTYPAVQESKWTMLLDP